MHLLITVAVVLQVISAVAIIVVILAVFYLATLVLGSKLDVSDEYKKCFHNYCKKYRQPL